MAIINIKNISLLEAAIQKCCKLGGLKERNVLSHNSGSWKFKIKVLAGLVPSEDSKLSTPSRPLSSV